MKDSFKKNSFFFSLTCLFLSLQFSSCNDSTSHGIPDTLDYSEMSIDGFHGKLVLYCMVGLPTETELLRLVQEMWSKEDEDLLKETGEDLHRDAPPGTSRSGERNPEEKKEIGDVLAGLMKAVEERTGKEDEMVGGREEDLKKDADEERVAEDGESGESSGAEDAVIEVMDEAEDSREEEEDQEEEVEVTVLEESRTELGERPDLSMQDIFSSSWRSDDIEDEGKEEDVNESGRKRKRAKKLEMVDEEERNRAPSRELAFSRNEVVVVLDIVPMEEGVELEERSSREKDRSEDEVEEMDEELPDPHIRGNVLSVHGDTWIDEGDRRRHLEDLGSTSVRRSNAPESGVQIKEERRTGESDEHPSDDTYLDSASDDSEFLLVSCPHDE